MFNVDVLMYKIMFLTTVMADNRPIALRSHNCRHFNITKSPYIANLLSQCDILVLQEHWLSDSQLTMLGDIRKDMCLYV